MPIMKLGRRAIAQIPEVTKPTTYFDSDLKGFGLKVLPSGAKSWVVEYRPGAGGRGVAKRRMTIGSPESLSPEQARDLASKTIAKVKLGADPAGERTTARQSESVDDLLDMYLDHHVRPKRKASTVEVYVGFAKHIRAAIGKKSAITITRADVMRLHRNIGKKHAVTANRVVGLLSGAISYAVKNKALPKGSDNPAADIEPFPESPRERYLTTKELARLGETLRLAETVGIPWEPDPNKKTKHAPKPENRRTRIDSPAAAALKLLVLTGCRLREILHLRWSDLDAERGLLFLPDSKTGKKTIVLAAPALTILEELPRLGLYVIASESAGMPDETHALI